MKQVKITLGKDGSIKVEAHGFKGSECLKKTEWINQKFGNPETELKNSFYEEEQVTITDALPGGYCG